MFVPVWSSAKHWSEDIMVDVVKLIVMILVLITHLCQVVLMCAESIQWQKLGVIGLEMWKESRKMDTFLSCEQQENWTSSWGAKAI